MHLERVPTYGLELVFDLDHGFGEERFVYRCPCGWSALEGRDSRDLGELRDWWVAHARRCPG